MAIPFRPIDGVPIVVHPLLDKPHMLDLGHGLTIYAPSMEALREQLDREADEAGRPRVVWPEPEKPNVEQS